MTEILSDEETDVMSIAVKELLHKQAEDSFCKLGTETAGQLRSQYDQERYRLVVRESALDSMLQLVAPKRFTAKVLPLAHYQ